MALTRAEIPGIPLKSSKTIDAAGVIGAADERAQKIVQEVLAGWNRAAYTWDIEGLAAAYSEDALMFGGRPGLSVGIQGMRDYFESYAGVLASTHLELVDQYIVNLAPGVLLTQGFGIFHFRLVSGQNTGTTMRTTLVLLEREGAWKIQQHHFSSIPDKPPIHG